MSRPLAVLSGWPSRVTMPLETVTANWSGSARNSHLDHVLRDFLLDFAVRAAVDAQHVGPADDPDQLALFSDHRKALDPAVIHKAGGAGDRFVRRHHDGRFGHEISGGHRGRLGEFIVIRRTRYPPSRVACTPMAGTRASLVSMSASDTTPMTFSPRRGRKRADPVFGEQGGDVLERGISLTATTRVVITSRTLVRMALSPLR